jgi:hypothetical protein
MKDKRYSFGVTYGHPGNETHFMCTDTIYATLAQLNSIIEQRYSDQIDKGLITAITINMNEATF